MTAFDKAWEFVKGSNCATHNCEDNCTEKDWSYCGKRMSLALHHAKVIVMVAQIILINAIVKVAPMVVLRKIGVGGQGDSLMEGEILSLTIKALRHSTNRGVS